MSRTVSRWAFLSDLHVPHLNEAAFEIALEHVRKWKPDVLVVGGDWIDASPASPYPNEDEGDLLAEYTMAAQQSKQLRKLAGKNAKLVRMVGNHEDRLEPHRMNIPRRLRGATHWKNFEPLAREWSLWQTVPYVKGREGCYQLGQVIFYHGWDVGTSSDELEGLQMANACGAVSHRLTVRGHTHTPVEVRQAMRTKTVPLPFWYANAGHLGPTQPPFMRNKDVGRWGRAILLGDARPGNPATLVGGGCQWSARLEVCDGT